MEHTSNPPFLSIVVPAYNEEKRIGESLKGICHYLAENPYTYEILVVDDGSKDKTLEICRAFAENGPPLRVVRYPVNRGKGFAVRTGMMEAAGENLLLCDADLATPMEELDRFLDYRNEGFDIVIASRPLKESHLVRHQPLYREWAGRAFNHVVRTFAVRDIHDTQCGFKLFSREAARSIFPICLLDGFSFDIEVLHIAQRLGFRIKEAPVHWYHMAGSKVHFVRDGFLMLLDVFRIAFAHRRLQGAAQASAAQASIPDRRDIPIRRDKPK